MGSAIIIVLREVYLIHTMNSEVLFGPFTSAGVGGNVLVEPEPTRGACFAHREAASEEGKRARGVAGATENTKEKPESENNEDKTEQERASR